MLYCLPPLIHGFSPSEVCYVFPQTFWLPVFYSIFTATVASAYTVVMRNGRRVEIPNTFTVTKSTLTYETAPGIQVTIPVGRHRHRHDGTTEQPTGGFTTRERERTRAETSGSAPQTRRMQATRSITNRDLEAYRRARIESERSESSWAFRLPKTAVAKWKRSTSARRNRSETYVPRKNSFSGAAAYGATSADGSDPGAEQYHAQSG